MRVSWPRNPLCAALSGLPPRTHRAAAEAPSFRHKTYIHTQVGIQDLLSTPTWSVRSLLPSSDFQRKDETASISAPQLRHLLRLSALPAPKTPKEEAAMIGTLQSQLHFVRDVQKVKTENVEPLRAIRDETDQGIKESAIGLDQLHEALAHEEIHGHSKRPRMQTLRKGAAEDATWDVLATASEKADRYFVVRVAKATEG